MNKLLLWALLALPLVCQAQALTAPATPAAPPMAPAISARGTEPPELLRDRLKITSAQQPLWDHYVSRLDAYTQQFYRERPAQPSEEEPATQQITRLVMNHQNRLAGLEDIEQAAKALYSSLDDNQKKSANLWLLASIPLFIGTSTSTTGSAEHRPDVRPGGEMRRRGGGGMGSGRF